MMIGTPGYMSPEQVRGAELDARTDVFSLGCVSSRCLTGQAPFAASDVAGVLAKVLFEDPPKPSELATGVSAAVDALVAAMLAKNPDERPRDAIEVARRLGAIADAGSLAPPAQALGRDERRVVSVVLAGRPTAEADTERTLRRTAHADVDPSALAAAVEPFGAELVVLPNGSVLLVMSGDHAATDQAARAARCALALRGAPELARGARDGPRGARRPLVGEAIDRAARARSRRRARQRSSASTR